MNTVGERRFYIHEDSFSALISRHPSIAEPVGRALAAAVASRVVRHHLIDSGEDLGLVDPGTFSGLAARLEQQATARLTDLFHGLVFAPAEPEQHMSTAAVLAPEERVDALCWESGYFTFATGPTAAQIMFEETGSLRALRKAVREDPACATNLNLITGRRSLFPRSDTIGVGPGTLPLYRVAARSDSKGDTLPHSPASEIVNWIESEFATAIEQEPQQDEGAAAHDLLAGAMRGVGEATRSLLRRLHV